MPRRAVRGAQRLLRTEAGATMAEYALMVGAVAVVGLVGAKALGVSLNTKFANEAGRVATP